MLEIPPGLIDTGDAGEGIREAGQNLLEPNHLMAVHHADQQGTGSLRVHSLRLEHSDTVAQLLHELPGELLRLPGDHLEFHGGFAALQNGVADAGAEIAVDQAQDHRLELAAVDEEGQHRHRGIEAEDQPDQAGLRVLFPHPGGYDVRSAGGAVLPDHPAVHSAADHTGRHRPQDGGGAGVIGDGA